MRHALTLVFLLALSCVAICQSKPWPRLDSLVSAPGQRLDQAGLSPAELKVLRATLGKLSKGSGCQNENIQTCGAPEGLFLAKLKISTNGHAAFVVRSQAACGTLGCPFWFIDTSSAGLVLIDDFGWGYRILPSQSHGYFDIVTAAGNHEVSLKMWSYDGHTYKVIRCGITEATDEPGVKSPIAEHICPSSTP